MLDIVAFLYEVLILNNVDGEFKWDVEKVMNHRLLDTNRSEKIYV